jgi:hypothetical protein
MITKVVRKCPRYRVAYRTATPSRPATERIIRMASGSQEGSWISDLVEGVLYPREFGIAEYCALEIQLI